MTRRVVLVTAGPPRYVGTSVTHGAKKIVSIGAGKGGVGKSVVAANLGVAMAHEGARVVIVDADLGGANQHTLFGITRPGPTLPALLDRTIPSLEDARIETSVANLTLVPGSGAVVGAANLPSAQKVKLLRHIRNLDADVVLVDIGAGMSFNVLDLFDVADLRLVVLAPELTAIQNGYGFLKGAVFRDLRRVAALRGKAAVVDDSPEAGQATGTVGQLLARVAEEDAGIVAAFHEALTGFGARIVGNQVNEPGERNILYATSRVARDFLSVNVPVLGYLRANRKVQESVASGRPFLLDASSEESGAVVRQVARSLLDEDVDRLRSGRAFADVAPPTPAVDAPEDPPPLPAQLARYARSSERIEVDCRAVLLVAGALVHCRVRDVSGGGALLDLDRPPAVGARGTLMLSDVSGRPSLPCVVRHTSPQDRRAGIEFTGEPGAGDRVAAEIARRFARKATT